MVKNKKSWEGRAWATAAIGAALVLAGMAAPGARAADAAAPGAPGEVGTWSYAGKTGVGTAYQPYGPERARSKVWFTLAQGVVTETTYGLIHQSQIKDIKLAIKGRDFVDVEDADTVSTTAYLAQDADGRPTSLAYKLVDRARNGAYETEKHIFTDPDANVLFVRVVVRALKGEITPYLLVDPQMAGTAGGDRADTDGGVLHAHDGDVHLVVKADRAVARLSAGFVGTSDGLTQLRRTGTLRAYADTGRTPGNVALTAQLAPVAAGTEVSYDFVVGFGASRDAALAEADASLKRGYAQVLAHYNGGRGKGIGWADYLAGLTALPRLAEIATDGGKLAYASAMVLKAQEDKSHPGALIASLSAPWGDTVRADTPSTGYRAVWPRDFYQCAMALLALGDTQTPLAALRYLQTVQVRPDTVANSGASGWFLQKTHVDGTPEWVGVQLDQSAMPIMLAWRLGQAGLVDTPQMRDLYVRSLKPAADFLVDGGTVGMGWNHAAIHPPATQQERWEEQGGYSPSTTAAEIAGLVAAGEIASQVGDEAAAARYRAAADSVSAGVEAHMLTTRGSLAAGGAGRYYLRIAPTGEPDADTPLQARNGQAPLPQDRYVDGGFLELVRYGVRRADFAAIRDSLKVLDDTGLPTDLRVRYDFQFAGESGSFPGWRRYGHDGYGENTADGGNYPADGMMLATLRGRVWPLLTGERGHYELALAQTHPGGVTDADIAQLRHTYVRALELFANPGLMIPEQVWDGVGSSGVHDWQAGQGTDSATPLAWSHAEYIKLLRSLADRQVWDRYAPVAARFAAGP